VNGGGAEGEVKAKPLSAQHSRRAKLPEMRTPNNRATQGKTSGARTVSQSEGPEESPHSRPKRFVGILKGTAEFVAAALAVVVGVHDAIQKPQVHAQTAQTSAPFSFYVSLHNPSLVLPMSDVRIECFVKNARTDHGVIETSFISVTANIQNVSIPPGETIQVNCPLDAIVTKAGYGNEQIAQTQLVSKFKTLGIERNTYSEMFKWNPISRKWTEGEIIN
jgi:hypothetical protein